jgi:hypothetical protein
VSFILDALKKLEQKRQQSHVPDLMTVHEYEANEAKKWAWWPYLLFGVLLLNAALLTFWILPREPQKPGTSVQVSASQQEKLPGVSEDEQSVTLSAKNQPRSREQVIVKDTGTPKENVVSSQLNAQELLISDTDDETQSEQPVRAEVQGQEIFPVEPESSGESMAAFSRQSAVEKEKTGDYAIPQETESPLPKENKSEQEIIDFNDLPQSVRRDMPDIKISGHIYSNDPDARLVNVNGQIIQSGETLERDLKVIEITETGVIFSYHKYRFYMRAY